MKPHAKTQDCSFRCNEHHMIVNLLEEALIITITKIAIFAVGCVLYE